MNQQCRGTTRSGEQCKLTGNFIDGYCHLHRKQKAPEREAAQNIPHDSPGREKPPLSTMSSDGPDLRVLLGLILCVFILLLLAVNRRRKG
jgi:hypothetical protein